PGWFPVLAYGFGALCWLTTATRILVARRDFTP
ncbi:MAG: CDP-alcohol phosphatidyltransferase family protein, partial [Oceanibaculum nanhaiense]|nr:CDP-alcohol phosphatidyltransferase family protein [Oceanibaculum nanhaiense]